MTLYICGIMHKVIEVDNYFYDDTYFGEVDLKNAEIKISKGMRKRGLGRHLVEL